jgi:hypothetical protein
VAEDRVAEPYRSCEQHCAHDLGEGVLISELLGGDGPHPPGYMLVTLVSRREPALFDHDLVPVAAC